MEREKKSQAHKGGRPAKAVKRDQHLAVKCSLLERKIIERKARLIQLTVSEYLRDLGLKGQANMTVKNLPKEVILFTATLNHLASNLNQIAHRRNRGDELSIMERAGLQHLASEVRNLTLEIKKYVQ